MKKQAKLINKVLYFLTSILTGILISLMLISVILNNTLLNSKFHKKMFEKNDIYSHVDNAVGNSLSSFVQTLKTYSPQNLDPHTYFFTVLSSSITPEMVKMNVDNIREETIKYFHGEKKFLPDIYLNMSNEGAQLESSNITENNSVALKALTSVDRVNLSAILTYINRNDIADALAIVRLMFFIIDRIPVFAALLSIILVIGGLAVCTKVSDTMKWLRYMFLTWGLTSVTAGIIMLAGIPLLISKNIYAVTSSLPLGSDVLIQYISDCVRSISVPMILTALLVLLTASCLAVLKIIPERLYEFQYPRKTPVYICIAAVFTVVLIFTGLKVLSLKREFDYNGYGSVAAMLVNPKKVTQIIPAKNEAVYTLQIKLVDSKYQSPVPDVEVNVNGRSSSQDKYFNETISTDLDGIAKLKLDKGNFRMSFNTLIFPTKYQIPSPFFFNMEIPGTTLITMSLDKADVSSPGIVEIEVLDAESMPVPGVQLVIDINNPPSEYPDTLLTYTNSEGIGIFKTMAGEYTVKFLNDYFPEQYLLPSPFEITVQPEKIKRYTIRLTNIKE